MYQLFFHRETRLKKKYWLFLISLIVFDSLSAFTPILLGYLVDFGLKKEAMNVLLGLGFLIIFFVVIRTAGSYFSMLHLDFTAFQIANHRKEDTYRHIHTLDSNFNRTFHVGELLNVINTDWENVRNWFTFEIKTISYSLIHFLIAFCYFAYSSFSLTLFILIFTSVLVFMVYRFFKKTSPYYEKLREENANYTRYIQDFIDGSRVLKSFHAGENESLFLQEKNQKLKKIDEELCLKQNRFFSAQHFLSYSLSIFFIIFLVFLFFAGKVTIAQMIILNSLMGYLQEPFWRLNTTLDRYQRVKTSEKRIRKILNCQSSVIDFSGKEVSTLLKPIVFDHVSVTLDEKEVLKDISFQIEPGSTVAFIGLTGSGKSTIANLLERFLLPTCGEIRLDNYDLSHYSLKDYRSHIGYVFQEPFLFSDTILNNIFFGTDYSKSVLDDLIRICNLNFVLELPKGFDTIIGERGVGLSGGEKQRISLARALAMKPELLILDDMTSALDIETENSIVSSIYQMPQKMTKVIIAEKIVSVQHADMIYVLDDGSILEYGTHEELLRKEGYYYQMYETQRRGI